MSYLVTNAIRNLPLPPSPKFVLWVLADQANDEGNTRHYASIPSIQASTGFSRQTIIDAIAWLEGAGLVVADRSNGRQTSYQITPDNYNPEFKKQSRRTDNRKTQPVQMPDPSGNLTSLNASINPSGNLTTPVQMPAEPVWQVDSTHDSHVFPCNTHEYTRDARKEKKPKSEKPPRFNAKNIELPENVDRETWNSFIDMRTQIKKPPTEKACELILKDLASFGVTANQSLENSIKSNWVGVFAVKQPVAQYQVPTNVNAQEDMHVPVMTDYERDENGLPVFTPIDWSDVLAEVDGGRAS